MKPQRGGAAAAENYWNTKQKATFITLNGFEMRLRCFKFQFDGLWQSNQMGFKVAFLRQFLIRDAWNPSGVALNGPGFIRNRINCGWIWLKSPRNESDGLKTDSNLVWWPIIDRSRNETAEIRWENDQFHWKWPKKLLELIQFGFMDT